MITITLDDARRLDGGGWQVLATVGQDSALARVPFVLEDGAESLDEHADLDALTAAIARRYA